MKLTPQDILNQPFRSKMKGYDKEEVHAFLIQVAEIYETENREKEEAKQKLDKMRESVEKFEKREDVLRDTLIAAQRFAAEIRENAKREAELMLKEAEMRSEEIVHRAIERQQNLREEIKTLKLKRKEIESDILHTLASLREVIESYRKEDDDFDKVQYLGK